MASEFKNFIAGDWVAPSTGEYFENRNPADWNDVIGRFPRSGPDDLKRAIASAKRGFAQWSKTPAPIRGQVLQRAGQLLVERKDAIARAMTREMGKVVAETGGDVQEGIDTAFYAATEGRRLFGRVVPSELRSKWAMSYRRPIGIAGLITPFNFPLAIPTWKMFPALLCGNAVIFKPAEDVPHTARLLVEILLEAGLPPEVVHRVDRNGVGHRHDLRPHAQAPVARDGRQERHDRDGRRGPGSGARRRAVGGVRHHGTALHRHEPPGGARAGARQAGQAAVRSGRATPPRPGARCQDGRRPPHQRGCPQEGRVLRGRGA